MRTGTALPLSDKFAIDKFDIEANVQITFAERNSIAWNPNSFGATIMMVITCPTSSLKSTSVKTYYIQSIQTENEPNFTYLLVLRTPHDL